MPIDERLLGAVSHYLAGMVSAASVIHSELEEHPERYLSDAIASAKQAFLTNGRAILADPARYAHQEGYGIKPEDEAFIKGLLEEGERADWNSKKQVMSLVDRINEYAPHGGFRS